MTSVPTKIVLLDLPIELLASILAYSPDLQALQNFMKTCKTIYAVFEQNHNSVLSEVLHRIVNIKYDVAIDADACQVAAEMRKNGPFLIEHDEIHLDHDLYGFMGTYRVRRAQHLATDQTFHTREYIIFVFDEEGGFDFDFKACKPAPLGPWPASTSDLSYLESLYRRYMLIQRCMTKFRDYTVSCHGLLNGVTLEKREAMEKPLSSSENRRIYRALYRFELYHILFRGCRESDTCSQGELG